MKNASAISLPLAANGSFGAKSASKLPPFSGKMGAAKPWVSDRTSIFSSSI